MHNGIADIAGIPRAAIAEFSTRRKEIEAHLEEHGQHSARAAQFATYATRRAKDDGVDVEGLLPGWRTRADANGLDSKALAATLGRVPAVGPPVPGSPEAENLYRWLASAHGLTARASTFGERDVIKAVCNALPGGGLVDQVLDLVDGFASSQHVLVVRADPAAATIRLHDGTVVPARTDEIRWTTPEMLELEMGLVDTALCRKATSCGIAASDAIEKAIAARPSMSDEQTRMVRAICSSGDGIEIVEGAAGAGKTFALAAARSVGGVGPPGDRLLARGPRRQATTERRRHSVVDYRPSARPRCTRRRRRHRHRAGGR